MKVEVALVKAPINEKTKMFVSNGKQVALLSQRGRAMLRVCQ